MPELFNKKELIDILENGSFSEKDKIDFEEIYLNNILETQLDSKATSAFTFFSPETPSDPQKIIFDSLASDELIKITTTSTYFQSHIMEILFERLDEVALLFKEKTLQSWFIQINSVEKTAVELFGPLINA